MTTHQPEFAHIAVYGASDDCIETEGLVSEEFYASPRGGDVLTVMVDDALYASVHIEYDPDGTGEWRVQPTALGSLVAVTPAPGEDTDGPRYDEHRCPRYSDKAVIDLRGIEARRVDVRCSPASSTPKEA